MGDKVEYANKICQEKEIHILSFKRKAALKKEAAAQQLMAAGDFAGAIDVLDELICAYPWEIGSWVSKANALIKLGEFEAAEETFITGINEYNKWGGPGRPPQQELAKAYFYYAFMFYDKKFTCTECNISYAERIDDLDDAWALVEEAILLHSSECEFYLLRALIGWELRHDRVDVLADFNQALELSNLSNISNRPERQRLTRARLQTYRSRAEYFLTFEEYDNAMSDVESMLLIDPQNEDALSLKIKILDQTKVLSEHDL
ncbi:MAG: tetratricopeptide repeat protein [Candidatus Margulisbacteria bacterium]|nr:tetratricopeptide repeat protein [Candidatus Margulisiibacteriota bacterium]MBU1021746.1 tetratricopeptide repeat protein [Candidatus Margulisiibacteriota bacterium]MBU1729492.1 tetratricopeptide repeat protein [Candidatus Margulisiibacteriota bacterium]MBU1955407.1 tetratricopeptide repeat protein [Candidatus Margulisiibacteriota bacterium]